MKSRLGFVFKYVWILALAALGIITLLTSPREERINEEENRTMAAAPSFSVQSVLSSDYMTQTENWLSDSIAGRDALISVSQKVDAALQMPKSEQMLMQEEMNALQQEMGIGDEVPPPLFPRMTA